MSKVKVRLFILLVFSLSFTFFFFPKEAEAGCSGPGIDCSDLWITVCTPTGCNPDWDPGCTCVQECKDTWAYHITCSEQTHPAACGCQVCSYLGSCTWTDPPPDPTPTPIPTPTPTPVPDCISDGQYTRNCNTVSDYTCKGGTCSLCQRRTGIKTCEDNCGNKKTTDICTGDNSCDPSCVTVTPTPTPTPTPACSPLSCGLLDDSKSGFECSESFSSWKPGGTATQTDSRSDYRAVNGAWSLRVDYTGAASTAYYSAFTTLSSVPSSNQKVKFTGKYFVALVEPSNPGLKACVQHFSNYPSGWLGEDCVNLNMGTGSWKDINLESSYRSGATSLVFKFDVSGSPGRIVYHADQLCATFEAIPTPTPTPTIACPPAPSWLNSSSPSTEGDDNITLSWGNVSNETGYKIERGGLIVATVGVDVTTWTDTGAKSCGNHTYRVASYKSGCPDAWSPSRVQSQGINTPSNISSSFVNNKISLGWTDYSQIENQFNVQRRIYTGGAWSAWSDWNMNVSQYTVSDRTKTGDVPTLTDDVCSLSPRPSQVQYQVRSRRTDLACTSNYVSGSQTTVSCCFDQAPSVPSLSSPANGATCQNTSTTLSWSGVNFGKCCSGQNNQYKVYLETGDSTPDILVATLGSGTTSWTASNLSPGTKYYWKVVASNGCSSLDASSLIWSFTTKGNPPSAPTISGSCACASCPEQNSACTTDWNDISGASRYALRVDDKVNGWTGTCSTVNPGDICNDNVANSIYSYTGKGGHTYETWVHTIDSCQQWSSSSNKPSFTAPYGAGKPTLSSPANHATCQNTSLTLKWNAPCGATSYRVYLEANDSTPDVLIKTTTSTSHSVSGLSANIKYYWKVVAYNAYSSQCGSTSSDVWSFTTKPVLSAPTGLTETVPIVCQGGTGSCVLKWNRVAGADHYNLSINGVGRDVPQCASSPCLYTFTCNAGTSYAWHVYTLDVCGTWYESVHRNFTVPYLTVNLTPEVLEIPLGEERDIVANVSLSSGTRDDKISRIDFTATTISGTDPVIVFDPSSNVFPPAKYSTKAVARNIGRARATATVTVKADYGGAVCTDGTPSEIEVKAPKPWFQTVGGDSHAQQEINSRIPATATETEKFYCKNLDGYPGVVSYGGSASFGSGGGSVSSRGWLAQDSPGYKYTYNYFYKKLDSPSENWNGKKNEFPSLPGVGETKVIYTTGGTSNSAVIPGFTLNNGGKLIILADAVTNITGNIEVVKGTNSFLAVISSDKINIDSLVIKVQGVFISNVHISTGDGGLLSAEGIFYANEFKLNRDLDPTRTTGANSNPAEVFTFRPDFLLSLPKELKSSIMSWQEVAP